MKNILPGIATAIYASKQNTLSGEVAESAMMVRNIKSILYCDEYLVIDKQCSDVISLFDQL